MGFCERGDEQLAVFLKILLIFYKKKVRNCQRLEKAVTISVDSYSLIKLEFCVLFFLFLSAGCGSTRTDVCLVILRRRIAVMKKHTRQGY